MSLSRVILIEKRDIDFIRHLFGFHAELRDEIIFGMISYKMHFSFHLHILNHLFLLAFKQQLYIITLKIDDNIPTINNKISEISSDFILTGPKLLLIG